LREVLIEALSLGFRIAELILIRLVTVGTFLVHSGFYGANKQAPNQSKELKAFIIELESKII
jgi:hypothetical protein